MSKNCVVVGLLLGSFWGQLSAQSQPVGMVVGIKGSATLLRGQSSSTPQLADLVLLGDLVTATAGQVEVIYCPKQVVLTIVAGTKVRFEAMEYRVEGGSPVERPARRCAIPRVALGAESLERIGGLKARGFPPIPVYLGGAVATAYPRFDWEPVEGDPAVYLLTLKNQQGKSVWKAEATGDFVEYPRDGEGLAPGIYVYEVSAQRGTEVVGQQSARIQIRPDENFSEPPGDDLTDLLTRAFELEEAGYYAEAARIVRGLRQGSEDDERWTRRLAWLYWNSGLITASSREKERLTP